MESYFMAENERMVLLSRIFETNAEGVWIFDGKWTLRHANRTSEKIIGWTPSLVGKSLEDFLAKSPASSNPCKEMLMEVAVHEGHWEGGAIVDSQKRLRIFSLGDAQSSGRDSGVRQDSRISGSYGRKTGGTGAPPEDKRPSSVESGSRTVCLCGVP